MNQKIKKLISVLEKKQEVEDYSNNNPFKVLISCVLSQCTREENTAKASKNLFKVTETPKEILNIPNEKIEKLIKASGFYKQKTKYIKQISRSILKEHGGKVPKNRKKLLKLFGVGYKTADVTLCYGHNIPALPVDTHVNRISKRLGVVNKKSNVEEVRKKLEKIIPKKKWHLINHGLVRFGRETCKPINPQCEKCPMSNVCDFIKNQ